MRLDGGQTKARSTISGRPFSSRNDTSASPTPSWVIAVAQSKSGAFRERGRQPSTDESRAHSEMHRVHHAGFKKCRVYFPSTFDQQPLDAPSHEFKLPLNARTGNDFNACGLYRIGLVDGARHAGVPVVHCRAAFRRDRKGSFKNVPLVNRMLEDANYLVVGEPAADVIPELGPDPRDLEVAELKAQLAALAGSAAKAG